VKKHRKKIIKIFILLSLIVAGGGYFFNKKYDNKKTEYITSPLKRGDVVLEVTANGTINPVNIVNVGTQVSGTIEKIYVDYNDKVEKGQLLAELDKSVLESSKRTASAQLRKAKTKRDLAKLEASRLKELFGKDYVAKSDLDSAETELESCEADYEEALANYEKAEINLGYAVVTSPVSGVIISREVDEGQTVASSLQAPELFTIAEDLTKMQIEASISEADIGNIKNGQDVVFSVDAFDDREFYGKVKLIRLNPNSTSNVVTYIVIIDIDNADMKLLPGMTAFITIVVNEAKDVFVVSNNLFKFSMKNSNWADEILSKKESYVYRLNPDNSIDRIKVEKGLSTGTITEISSPLLKKGDLLIEDILNSAEDKAGSKGFMMGGGPR
jgi:HlyD family secretion protein